MDQRKTNIQVSVDTREQLKELGKMGESYDDVIKRLLIHFQEN